MVDTRPGAPLVPWTDGIQVEERRLQEYMCQKQHTLVLRGAAEVNAHTLATIPTTNAEDGFVHFGDSLMLRSGASGGLLQADAQEKVPVADGVRTRTTHGHPLSTGSMIKPCPRNVFTLSRVRDDDEYGESAFIHYGQTVRFTASTLLTQDRALYLFASVGASGGAAGGENEESGETLACLYAHACAGTQWRVLPAEIVNFAVRKTHAHLGDVVKLGVPVRLEGVSSGRILMSDTTVRMTNYGNEWRVFGGVSDDEGAPTVSWSFVNAQWVEDTVAEARSGDGLARSLGQRDGVAGPDPGELLQNPVARAEHDLHTMETQGGAAVYSVLMRVYPQLRNGGMHVVRRLRRMCMSADVDGSGTLPLYTFQGFLSWVAIRLREEEIQHFATLFEVPPAGSRIIDFRRFFALMESNMAEVRRSAVRDAYTKLEGLAAGGFVEVPDLQRNWNPRCHPSVQQGVLHESEAREEFLRQWDVTSADGLISFEEFLDYYQDVSVAVGNDEIFVELVRCGWGL